MGRPFSVGYLDAHYHFPKVFTNNTNFLHDSILYLGAGIGAGAWVRNENCGRFECTWQPGSSGSGDGYFLRVIFGYEYYVPMTRVGIFTEFVPSILIYPTNKTIYDGILGVRFYF